MGKSNRKKKLEKIELRKIKIKVGKKKPVINATSTSFKSQAIYIREQLKTQDENEILSTSKQSLHELLSHLNHFSSGFRLRALNGIKEIMQKNLSHKHFDSGSVMLKVAKMMTDDDSDVRKACTNVLQFLFGEISELKMAPYFSLVLSYLYCSMSHISIQVQKDSLKVVDLFMKHYPNLMRRHAGTKLLQYFLEMISTKENSHKSSSKRILLVTFVPKKETIVQWRNSVLAQIFALLKVLQPQERTVKAQTETLSWNSDIIHLKLIHMDYKEQGLVLDDIQKSNIVASKEPTKQELVETLIPLLFQCWMEASASDILHKNAATIQTMIHVLSITNLLCKFVHAEADNKADMVNWLRATFSSRFRKHFFNPFPFEQPEGMEGQQVKETLKQSQIVTVNLMVCDLCTFLASKESKDNGIIMDSLSYVGEYLALAVDLSLTLRSQQLEIIVSSLERLFSMRKCIEEAGEIIDVLYLYCCSSKCTHSGRAMIMKFMMEQYENHTTFHLKSKFKKLLTDLHKHFLLALQRLANSSSEACKTEQNDSSENLSSILKCMQCAVRSRDDSYFESLSRNLSKLIDSMNDNHARLFCAPKLHCIKCLTLQNSIIACLLPHLKQMSEKDFMSLTSLCCNEHFYLESCTLVVDVLLRKVIPDQSKFHPLGKVEMGFFFKFLLSVLLAVRSSPTAANDESSPSNEIALERHEVICNCICNSLKRIASSYCDAWKMLNAFFQRKIKIISVKMERKSIIGLLKLAKILALQDHVQSDFAGTGSSLASYSLNYFADSHEWGVQIERSLAELLRTPLILESYINKLTDTVSSRNIKAMTKLLEVTELQESCMTYSTKIANYVMEIEKSEDSSDAIKLKSIVSAFCSLP